jgi:hypothetical protein
VIAKLKKFFAPLEKIQIVEVIWLCLKYLKSKKSDKKLPSLRIIFLKSLAMFTNRLKVVRSDNSFAGEHSILSKTMSLLGISGGYLVDIGAADGIRQSSTIGFLKEGNWQGTLFEYSPESFSRLAFLYSSSDQVNLSRVKVTPDNVVQLLEGYQVPRKFEYLNIDIDSYDLSVLRALIDYGFRPKIVSMEINEKFPPHIYFEVLYKEDHYWHGDHFFGCSLTAAYENLKVRGYSLESLEYNNVIFVDSSSETVNIDQISLREIYNAGYKEKKDRQALFPWNKNVEILLQSDYETSEKVLEELFSEYKGYYTLEARTDHE